MEIQVQFMFMSEHKGNRHVFFEIKSEPHQESGFQGDSWLGCAETTWAGRTTSDEFAVVSWCERVGIMVKTARVLQQEGAE